MAKKDNKAVTAEEREAAILARMNASHGALNKEQATLAVELQIAEDAAKDAAE